MNDDFNSLNSENKTNSVREQLAKLEAELGNEIPEEENKKNEEPIQTRFEEKREEDVFKDPEKEKKKMGTKVKVGLILSSAAILLIIILMVFMQIKDTKSTPQQTPGNVDKITDKTTPPQNAKTEEEIKNKLEVPTEVSNANEALGVFANNNEIVVSYFVEMKDNVVDYINRDRNDIYIEDVMGVYKKSLLRDIEIFAKYKPMYEKYEATDLYQVTLDRLQNAYELARTTKNVMTEKALINNTNQKIEKEEELNTRATTAFVTFLDYNEIEYSLDDDKITIK